MDHEKRKTVLALELSIVNYQLSIDNSHNSHKQGLPL